MVTDSPLRSLFHELNQAETFKYLNVSFDSKYERGTKEGKARLLEYSCESKAARPMRKTMAMTSNYDENKKDNENNERKNNYSFKFFPFDSFSRDFSMNIGPSRMKNDFECSKTHFIKLSRDSARRK